MGLDELKNRNIAVGDYINVLENDYPKTGWDQFKQVAKRSVKGELFGGLKIVMKMMTGALFNNEMHTVQYPSEKLPIGARYRAVHKLLG